MSDYSRGLLAIAYEAAALLLAYQFHHHGAALAIYFSVHAVASAMGALTLLPLVPRNTIVRPRAAFVFLCSVNFFLPVLGVLGTVGAAAMAKVGSAQALGRQFNMHLPPVYDPRSEEVPIVRTTRGVRVQLADAAVPLEARLRALRTVQSMPARLANPLIREMLSDPADDLRLVAYGILDTREKTINARIQAAAGRLARASPGEQAVIEKQLAELYWELIYQGLVHGDLREHAATQARHHLSRALARDRADPALRALSGQIALATGDYGEARSAFEDALALGLPDSRVLPYLAEVAFRTGRFDEVRSIAHRLARLPGMHRIDQVIEFWNGSGERAPA